MYKMRKIKYKITLNETDKERLEKIVKTSSVSQKIAKRARIILMAESGEYNNKEIAKYVGIDVGEVTKWRKRWLEDSHIDIDERLQDKTRSGRPAIIIAEQWCKIIALACEKPEDHGVEETYWSRSTLRATIIKENIVDAISTTHVGNFLKKSNYNLTEVSIG